METSTLPVSAADPSPSLYNSHDNMHKTIIKKITIIISRTILYNQLTNVKTEGGGGGGGGERVLKSLVICLSCTNEISQLKYLPGISTDNYK